MPPPLGFNETRADEIGSTPQIDAFVETQGLDGDTLVAGEPVEFTYTFNIKSDMRFQVIWKVNTTDLILDGFARSCQISTGADPLGQYLADGELFLYTYSASAGDVVTCTVQFTAPNYFNHVEFSIVAYDANGSVNENSIQETFAYDVNSASSGGIVDLVSTLSVPSVLYKSLPFTVTGTVANASAADAQRTEIIIKAQPSQSSIKDLNVECAASGGAVCPDSYSINKKTGIITATVAQLPGFGALDFTITGTSPSGSDSSVTFTLDAAVLIDSDSDPSSNVVMQAASLYKPATTLSITQTQDKLVVASGEARTYTVTIENTGDNPTITTTRVISIYAGYAAGSLPEGTQYQGEVLSSTPNNYYFNSNISYKVTCSDETTAGVECPSWAQGAIKSGKEFVSDNSALINIPAHSKLVLNVEVTHTLRSCVSTSTNYITVGPTTRAVNKNGLLIDYADVSAPTLVGAVVGERCVPGEVQVTTQQDKIVVDSGETRTYTITIENMSDEYAVSTSIDDEFLYAHATPFRQYLPDYPYVSSVKEKGGAVDATMSYSISCVEKTEGVDCPFVTEEKTLDSQLANGNNSIIMGIVGDSLFDSIVLPPRGKVVLEIPVTITLNECTDLPITLFYRNYGSYSRVYPVGSTPNVVFSTKVNYVDARLIEPARFPTGRDYGLPGIINAIPCPQQLEVYKTVTNSTNRQVVDSHTTSTYTIVYENPNDVGVDLKLFGILEVDRTAKENFNKYAGFGAEDSRGIFYAGSIKDNPASVTVSFAFNCVDDESTIQCPSWLDGQQVSAEKSLRQETRSVSSGDNAIFLEKTGLIPSDNVLHLPAHSKFTYTIDVTYEQMSCILDHNGEKIVNGNSANVVERRYSDSAQPVNSDEVKISERNSINGSTLVRGEPCQLPNVKVSITQDKDIMMSGDTRTYTVTYENIGNADAVFGDLNPLGGQLRWDFIAAYHSYSDAFSGTEFEGITLSDKPGKKSDFDAHSGSALSCSPETSPDIMASLCDVSADSDALRENIDDGVVIPAGSKLVLNYSVTQSIQDCIEGSNYLLGHRTSDFNLYFQGLHQYGDDSIEYALVGCYKDPPVVVNNDVSVNTRVSSDGVNWAAELGAGDSVVLRVNISNTRGTVSQVPFVIQLPVDGIMNTADFADAVATGVVPAGEEPFTYTCSRVLLDGTVEPASCPDDIAYNSAEHTISGTWLTPLASAETARIEVSCWVGMQPNDILRSYVVRADVTGVQGDANYASNYAEDTFWVRNLGAVPPPLLLPITGGAAADMFLVLGGLTIGGALVSVWYMRLREQRKANAVARQTRACCS